LKTRKYKESVIDSKKVLEMLPDDIESYQLLASAYFSTGSGRCKKGDFTGGINHFSLSIKYNDQVSSVYASRAKAYMNIGEIENARIDLSIALKLDSSNIQATSLQTLLLPSDHKNDFPKRMKNFQHLFQTSTI
jgi:tetratricopeptide (TPR) repeat protein